MKREGSRRRHLPTTWSPCNERSDHKPTTTKRCAGQDGFERGEWNGKTHDRAGFSFFILHESASSDGGDHFRGRLGGLLRDDDVIGDRVGKVVRGRSFGRRSKLCDELGEGVAVLDQALSAGMLGGVVKYGRELRTSYVPCSTIRPESMTMIW